MLDKKLQMQLDFMAEMDKMKSVYRRTSLIDLSRTESDAEHSWHFALAAMLLFEYCDLEEVDLNRVIRMALVHDLVEIYAGDTFAYDEAGYNDKEKREKAAADKLFALLPPAQGEEYRSLWEEFDAEETPDALYAAAIDRIQPLLNNFHTEGFTWKNGVTAEQVRKRMSVIKKSSTALHQAAEHMINESIKKGWLKE